ncbi:MAG: heterodisulfide reductase-related iron-sulfur binding cluster [Promethearchaeota archaeon]
MFNNLALDDEEIRKNYPENPLEFFKDKKLCLFKACLEKYFPGVRYGIYDLLEVLNLDVSTSANQSCCAGTFFQRNLITRAQFSSINERNLNEINHMADILLVSCNGCYNSLLRGRDFLRQSNTRKRTQAILNNLKKKDSSGENYPEKYELLKTPRLRIMHDLDFLHLIKDEVVNTLKFNLKGLKVATHYGCHYLNLERDKRIENGLKDSFFKDKTKLEDLITLFGGVPVDYQERDSCCGWGASQIVLHEKEALKITFQKLKSVQNVGADLILTPCPTCLYTLGKPEHRENILKFYGEFIDVPVIHLNELIAILRGCEEDRCVTIRKNDPRVHKIYEIITND